MMQEWIDWILDRDPKIPKNVPKESSWYSWKKAKKIITILGIAYGVAMFFGFIDEHSNVPKDDKK